MTTVAELIAKLQQVDPSLEVHTEGCDCEGAVGAVSVWKYAHNDAPFAYIERPDGDKRDDHGSPDCVKVIP